METPVQVHQVTPAGALNVGFSIALIHRSMELHGNHVYMKMNVRKITLR